MVKKISKGEKIQLIGLLTLARNLGIQETLIENSAANILKLDKLSASAYDRGGWLITDNMYGNEDIEETVNKFLSDNKILYFSKKEI